MIRSVRTIGVFFIQATALIFLSMAATIEAEQVPVPRGGSPNWEHVRTIGGRLGGPRTLASEILQRRRRGKR